MKKKFLQQHGKKLFSAGINESEVRNFRAEDSHRL
jgi:hypothetical protein